MKKIIALRGKGGSGKTTTINLLPSILNNHGYSQVENMYQSHGADFLDIFEKNGIKVGITSSGDSFDLVKDRLDDLVKESCDVCICACRTFDRRPPGTNAATKRYSDYKTYYLEKEYASDSLARSKANASDAQKLYEMI